MPEALPGQTTLGTLRRLAAAEADQPTPDDATNVEMEIYNAFANRSYREVIGLLVDLFQDQFINPPTGNPFAFLTTPGKWLYPLPNDFFKLLRMDCLQQPNNISSAVTMKNFMNLQSNMFQGWTQPPPGVWVPLYRVTGDLIELIPKPPQVGLQVVVNYVPLLPDMVDRGVISLDAAFNVGDSVTISAQPTVPQGPPVNGVLPALASQVKYVAIANNAIPATRSQFHCGTDALTAAANLAGAMQAINPWTTGSIAQDKSVVQVSVEGNTLTLQLLQPLAVVWSSLADGSTTVPAPYVNLSPLPPATQWNPYGSWFNFCSILNGFDELVIIDMAIKILSKQRQPGISVLEGRKAALWQQLRTQANNRNAAQNARVTNVRVGRRIGRFGWR